jgi:K+-transporting ATPase KdpF subunit
MTTLSWIAGVITVGLIVYLTIALLYPEKLQ